VLRRLLGVYGKLKAIALSVSAEDAQSRLVEEAKSLIQDICNEHVFAVQSFVHREDLKASLSRGIQDECQELIDYIEAAKRFNLEVNSRSKDRVISFGEKLSCQFMAALLRDQVRIPISIFELADLTLPCRESTLNM
jgi:aspartate kinase